MVFSERLRKNGDYRLCYRKGKSFADRYMILHVRKNNTSENRIGISASKKCGNSVIRHSFIRRIREIYRLNEEMLFPGFDLVVSARIPVGDIAGKDGYYRKLESSFLTLTKRSGIYKGAE